MQLKNFRTYSNLTLSIDSRLSFILGKNAYGKTNIIEAVNLLSNGRSFRGAADRDMINYGNNAYHISANFRRLNQLNTIDFGCEESAGVLKRRVKLNGKLINNRSELIGNFISVIFSPADIAIADSGPQLRRRFMDMVLSNQDLQYLDNIMHYNRALKQRNAFLKRIKLKLAEVKDVLIWDRKLVELAEKIIKTRKQFIIDFQKIFSEALDRISNGMDSLQLILVMTSKKEETDYAEALQQMIRRDTLLGFTTIGPHRHNILFEKDGRDIVRFGSQGQKRSLVLALRIAQFYYLKKKLNFSPILLIDDVIRELDVYRRESFIKLLQECGQAIFTTPDMSDLSRFLNKMKNESTVYEIIEPGKMIQRSI